MDSFENGNGIVGKNVGTKWPTQTDSVTIKQVFRQISKFDINGLESLFLVTALNNGNGGIAHEIFERTRGKYLKKDDRFSDPEWIDEFFSKDPFSQLHHYGRTFTENAQWLDQNLARIGYIPEKYLKEAEGTISRFFGDKEVPFPFSEALESMMRILEYFPPQTRYLLRPRVMQSLLKHLENHVDYWYGAAHATLMSLEGHRFGQMDFDLFFPQLFKRVTYYKRYLPGGGGYLSDAIAISSTASQILYENRHFWNDEQRAAIKRVVSEPLTWHSRILLLLGLKDLGLNHECPFQVFLGMAKDKPYSFASKLAFFITASSKYKDFPGEQIKPFALNIFYDFYRRAPGSSINMVPCNTVARHLFLAMTMSGMLDHDEVIDIINRYYPDSFRLQDAVVNSLPKEKLPEYFEYFRSILSMNIDKIKGQRKTKALSYINLVELKISILSRLEDVNENDRVTGIFDSALDDDPDFISSAFILAAYRERSPDQARKNAQKLMLRHPAGSMAWVLLARTAATGNGRFRPHKIMSTEYLDPFSEGKPALNMRKIVSLAEDTLRRLHSERPYYKDHITIREAERELSLRKKMASSPEETAYLERMGELVAFLKVILEKSSCTLEEREKLAGLFAALPIMKRRVVKAGYEFDEKEIYSFDMTMDQWFQLLSTWTFVKNNFFNMRKSAGFKTSLASAVLFFEPISGEKHDPSGLVRNPHNRLFAKWFGHGWGGWGNSKVGKNYGGDRTKIWERLWSLLRLQKILKKPLDQETKDRGKSKDKNRPVYAKAGGTLKRLETRPATIFSRSFKNVLGLLLYAPRPKTEEEEKYYGDIISSLRAINGTSSIGETELKGLYFPRGKLSPEREKFLSSLLNKNSAWLSREELDFLKEILTNK